MTGNNINFDNFLEDLSSEKPTPGGGSVAALSGSVGTALLIMVTRISLKKPELDEKLKSEFEELMKSADGNRKKFRELIEDDAKAYDTVLAAFKLPKSSESEKKARSVAIQAAFKHAAEVPLNVVELASKMLESVRLLVEKGSENCISDSAVALNMLRAAVTGGRLNVEINLKYIKDEDYKKDISDRLKAFTDKSNELINEANIIISERF